MVFVLGLVMIVVTAFLVCLPLLSGGVPVVEQGGTLESTYRWEKQKRDAYAAIKEAELDFQMGKLARADYELIRRAQEARAVEALEALERDLRARSPKGGPGACPACGQEPGPGAFCTTCGAAVAALATETHDMNSAG